MHAASWRDSFGASRQKSADCRSGGSHIGIVRLLGAVLMVQVTTSWSDLLVALTATDFVPTTYEFAARRHSILQRISHVVVAGSCLAPAGQLSLQLQLLSQRA